MGFGLPSAIGAKVAAPNKMVIDIDGDASFSMTAMELATASQSNISVKVMVLNDGYQGMVVQWQGLYRFSCPLTRFNGAPVDLFYNGRHTHARMINPDFVQLAKSMGAHAIRASNANELPEKIKEFLEYDGNKPVLLECIVESHQHVFPMVCPPMSISLLVIDPCLLYRFRRARRYMNKSYTPNLGTIKKRQKHSDRLFVSGNSSFSFLPTYLPNVTSDNNWSVFSEAILEYFRLFPFFMTLSRSILFLPIVSRDEAPVTSVVYL